LNSGLPASFICGGFILDPANASGSIGAVKKAIVAKIPVLLVNAEINQEGLAKAQLVSDNAQGAALGAQQWVKQIGQKGNYAELLGAPSDNNAATRSNGYTTVLSQFDGLKLVDSQVANWNRSQGYDKMQSMLQAHPNIVGVISGNDEMALGAIADLKQYTVLRPVAIFSAKAVDEANSFLKTGKTGAASEKKLFDCALITKANVSHYTAPFTLSTWQLSEGALRGPSGRHFEVPADTALASSVALSLVMDARWSGQPVKQSSDEWWRTRRCLGVMREA
jgi:erythritol transport system substrate-binding protein